MARNLDDYDYEVQLAKDEKIKVGFMVNFKSMSVMIERITEETKEIDDKYPKSELMKIWGGIMFCYEILFVLSYQILFVATLPFIFFYSMSMYHLFKAWKRFNYKMGMLRLATFGGIIIEIALAVLIQALIFG